MKYADHIRKALRDKGIHIRPLSVAVGKSYEHCRRIVMGDLSVSAELNSDLCRALDLDTEEMWRLVQQERAAEKYGAKAISEHLDPRGKVLFDLWRELGPNDREVLVVLAEALVSRRRDRELGRHCQEMQSRRQAE